MFTVERPTQAAGISFLIFSICPFRITTGVVKTDYLVQNCNVVENDKRQDFICCELAKSLTKLTRKKKKSL